MEREKKNDPALEKENDEYSSFGAGKEFSTPVQTMFKKSDMKIREKE